MFRLFVSICGGLPTISELLRLVRCYETTRGLLLYGYDSR